MVIPTMLSCPGPCQASTSLCGPGSDRLEFCSQDYISLIANSLFLYLATLLQLYLFLCSKMNNNTARIARHSVLQVGY